MVSKVSGRVTTAQDWSDEHSRPKIRTSGEGLSLLGGDDDAPGVGAGGCVHSEVAVRMRKIGAKLGDVLAGGQIDDPVKTTIPIVSTSGHRVRPHHLPHSLAALRTLDPAVIVSVASGNLAGSHYPYSRRLGELKSPLVRLLVPELSHVDKNPDWIHWNGRDYRRRRGRGGR